MLRYVFAFVLMAAVSLDSATGYAAEGDDNKILGLSTGEFAIGVAAVVTGLRVLAVLLVGNRFLGPSVGTALVALYLGHVVAEGAIYGAGAGAGAYALGSARSDPDRVEPPSILPRRLDTPVPDSGRLPLEMGTRP